MNYLLLFPSVRNKFILSALGIVAVLVAYGIYMDKLLILTPAIILWVLSAYLFLVNRAAKRMKGLLEALNNGCKVQAFVDGLEKEAAHQHMGSYRNFLYLNLTSGYLNLGQPEKADKALDEVKLNLLKDNSRDAQLRVIYWFSRLNARLLAKDRAGAKAAMAELKAATDNRNLKAFREGYTIMLERLRVSANMLDGDFHGAEKVFREMLEMEETKMNKVMASYGLGVTCKAIDRPEDARKALTYVVEQGGDSCYVARAQAILNEME